MIKIFGIGNILLCDEGIGVRVVEKLKEDFLLLNDEIKNEKEKVSVIVGETDYLFCLENVEDDDFIIIIDATYFMIRPASITMRSLQECDDLISTDFINDLSAHEESFIKILRREKSNIQGCLIGIEIGKIDYSLELSKDLSKKFNNICREVYDEVYKRVTYYRENIINKCLDKV